MSNFNVKVRRQIDRLRHGDYRIIESEVTKKRLAWCKQRFQTGENRPASSPRSAYETLFFDYMGLDNKEVPILSETETVIVWSSFNRCPTLEACRELKLDTREVCRSAYEKSTQAFVSQIDPRLRFLRDYREIRPHSHHCREMIVRIDFEQIMRGALEEASKSRSSGNKGYGAVVVLGNRIIGKAHDTAGSEKDPSLHAEANAIREAVRTLGDTNLCGAMLFSTCEPCPMCSSLAVWANVTSIIYGTSIEEAASLGKSRIRVNAEEIVSRSPMMVEVFGGVLKDECLALYS